MSTTTAQRPRPVDIDPRLRQRREAVRRQGGRRRLLGLLGALLVLAVAADGWLLLHSRVFAARAVTVTGSPHTSAARVVAAGGLSFAPPLAEVDPGAVAARIEQLPWVRRATVVRHWPDGVDIAVTERVPVAVVAETGGWAEVDRTGRVLAVPPARPPGQVQLVSPVPTPPPGDSLGRASAGGLLVAATLPPAFAALVTQVRVGPGGDVSLALVVPVTVDLGGPTQLGAKYEDVAALLAGAPLSAGDVLDVSVPDAPTVTGG